MATRQEDLGREQIRRPGRTEVENKPRIRIRQEYRNDLLKKKVLRPIGENCDISKSAVFNEICEIENESRKIDISSNHRESRTAVIYQENSG